MGRHMCSGKLLGTRYTGDSRGSRSRQMPGVSRAQWLVPVEPFSKRRTRFLPRRSRPRCPGTPVRNLLLRFTRDPDRTAKKMARLRGRPGGDDQGCG